MQTIPLYSAENRVGHMVLTDEFGEQLGALLLKTMSELKLNYACRVTEKGADVVEFRFAFAPAFPATPPIIRGETETQVMGYGKPKARNVEKCGARKAQGWGGMSFCVFPKGHPPGQHSWSVT